MLDKGTWVRIIAFFLAWINTVLAQWGYDLPNVSEEFISIVIAAAISVWTGWKDNSVTKKAIHNENFLKNKGLK